MLTCRRPLQEFLLLQKLVKPILNAGLGQCCNAMLEHSVLELGQVIFTEKSRAYSIALFAGHGRVLCAIT